MSAAPATAAAIRRRALLARVHVARKQLALAEDSYRAILSRIAGQDSAARIDNAGLVRVIAEFERLGLKPLHKQPASRKPHVRKVWALWTDMRHLVRDPSREGLRRFVQRMTGITDPEWLSGEQANRVIEALKDWRAREAGRQAQEAAHADPG